MAEQAKTGKKRPAKPFTGKEGKTFTKDYQPTPEAKSKGWQELRAERMLTQSILKKMAEGNNLKQYIASLVRNAKKGNPKAIETINKCIEDDIMKIQHTVTNTPLMTIDPLADVQDNNSTA